jgi:predicted PurR-regulated permease PerM
MFDKNNTINISTLTLLKVALIVLSIWFLWSIKEVLLLLLISIIIASAMDPLVDFLSRKKVPRSLSVLFVYALFIGLIVLVVYLMVPPINEQFKELSQQDIYQQFQDKFGIYRDELNSTGIGREISNSIKEFAGNLAGALFQTTKGVLSGFVSVITVLAISFYLTVEENGMKNFIKNLTPYKHHAYIMKLINKIQRKMGAWVLGQLILSTVIFGLTFIGLTFLKVEFALILALIAGLLEVVPFIGPIISAIPAVFFAFLQSPALALAVVILYIIVQQLENHVIVPVVMSRSVGLNPVMVILGVLVGGTLGGIIGAIIAVPLIAGISVFVTDMMEDNDEPSESSA